MQKFLYKFFDKSRNYKNLQPFQFLTNVKSIFLNFIQLSWFPFFQIYPLYANFTGFPSYNRNIKYQNIHNLQHSMCLRNTDHGPWQQRKKICWTTINGRRRLQNQPRFYRACRLLANWRRTEKSKRKREREREVSTRPLIPLWDAIIVRERMQWETTAPRRTTGSEGALIKLKNIVAARLLEHSKDTEAGKTDRETDGGENLATYVHTQEKENHLWERASIWERERERYFFRELIRDERSRWKTQTWVEIVAISVMEINEIIGIVVGGEKNDRTRNGRSSLNSATRNTGCYCWLADEFFHSPGRN